MSLAFLGTSDFAVGVLERLDPPPALVVTRPDRPRGRGRRLASPPAARAARAAGIELAQPEDVAALDLREFDEVVVCAFGALLREPLLSHPGLVNVHPSLLPRWRGAAPIERAIMAGDRETGVSIMRVVAALDAGPVCLQEAEPIGEQDTYGTLSVRLVELAAKLLERWRALRPACREQGEDGATYAQKIAAADRALDPARPVVENWRVVRALSPHVGAKAGELGVWAAAPAPAAGAGAVAPGELRVERSRVLWGCAGGALELLCVQPPGGRPMAAADYARGHDA